MECGVVPLWEMLTIDHKCPEQNMGVGFEAFKFSTLPRTSRFEWEIALLIHIVVIVEFWKQF